MPHHHRRLLAVFVFVPALAEAQFTPFQTISATASGPLTSVFVGNDGSQQIAHLLDPGAYQVYPPDSRPGDYGTILSVGGNLYGPSFDAHEQGSATSNLSGAPNYLEYTPVSQTGVLGAGTAADPFRVVTVLAATGAGLEVTETTLYVVGQESFLTELRITNTGTAARSGVLYRAADCYLGGSDSGYGFYDAVTGAIACSENANNTPPGRIEQWLPISAGSHYFQANYSGVWSQIATGLDFPDLCLCGSLLDNGAGLSWAFTVSPGGNTARSHLTTFSVVGNLPVTTLKTADVAQVAPGGATGYTLFFDNPNVFAVTLSDIVDTLPAGFTYLPGSTTGLVATDPAISGQQLAWAGPATVPGQGTAMLHFAVTAATATGAYFNNAGALAQGGITVAPTGDTAEVVVSTEPADGGVGPGDGAVGPQDGAIGPEDGAVEPEDGGPGAPDGGPGADLGVGPDSGTPAPDTGLVEDDGGLTEDTGLPAPDAAPAADAASPQDAGGTGGDTGGGPSADGSAGGDGGSAPDGSGGSMGASERSDDSCGCTAARTPARGSAAAALVLLGALLSLRRRRG